MEKKLGKRTKRTKYHQSRFLVPLFLKADGELKNGPNVFILYFKNHSNFVYPKLILQNQSHASVRVSCSRKGNRFSQMHFHLYDFSSA